jgi:hypothetical protein
MTVGGTSRALLAATLALWGASGVRAVQPAPVPAWLPHYDLDIDLDVAGHTARVRQQATWTNPHPAPTRQLVFNAHSHYVVPKDLVGFMAKTLEILRVNASDALGVKDPPLEIDRVTLVGFYGPGGGEVRPPTVLAHRFEGDTATTLVVDLPRPVGESESVTVVIEFTMHLPNKQGRWGQWCGVTFLSNWLPVFAVYGHKPPPPPRLGEACVPQGPPPPLEGPCWQPTPFVPWHQPFFNEAASYHVRVALPADQKVACTGTIRASTALEKGRKLVEIEAPPVRDFAFLCSDRYHEYPGEVEVAPGRPPVRIHIMAFPEHEFYARQMVDIARTALDAYSHWFGPYPYEDFTIAESYFGWNGNECGALVMIDERVFDMPHLAAGFVQYLVSHEICHQWWYNVVGTNGHCETWMDEGLAVFFSHRLLDRLVGKNNKMMKYPKGLDWLPNIRREDYRYFGMYGTFGRGENGPTVQEMSGFGHVVNLFSLCYDKGSRIVGIIEDRMGETAFLDFFRRVFCRYQYRILRVADFQRELEEYTGQRWDEFFAKWLYGPGITDWAVAKVELNPTPLCRLCRKARGEDCTPTRAVIFLEQRAECSEATVLGIALPGHDGYPVRIPIVPRAGEYEMDDPPVRVTAPSENKVVVEVELPAEPEQITVDPDQVLVDRDPVNNYWHKPVRWRFTPIYTFLEETDLTCAYDCWNIIFGPWLFGTAYYDAWYTRSTMAGVRIGAYRTQVFDGGAYVAYRTDIRDVVAGVDGMWDHWPGSHFQVGFNLERRLAEAYSGDPHANRGVLYGRYVFNYGSSLYLPPIEYVEAYATYQDNFLPFARQVARGSVRPENTTTGGVHYRIDYLTPYWDPEGGFRLDLAAEAGGAGLPDEKVGLGKFSGQFSYVYGLPDFSEGLADNDVLNRTASPVLRWLGDTRLALRIFGATSVPARGEFFTMGADPLFRGFDQAQRQGSSVWVGSAEWRVPLATGLTYDACDHIFGLRNVYGAAFYDAGDAYGLRHQVGPVAQAVGGGLRLDVSWFSLVERTTLRVDVAKSLTDPTPLQFWFGVGLPF